MMKEVFKKYMKQFDVNYFNSLSNSQKNLYKSNHEKQNNCLIVNIAKLIKFMIQLGATNKNYAEISRNQFINNGLANQKYLKLLKNEGIIECKKNSNGKQTFLHLDNETIINMAKQEIYLTVSGKKYKFTDYGWKLITDENIAREIDELTKDYQITLYNTPEQQIKEAEYVDQDEQFLLKSMKNDMSLSFEPAEDSVMIREYLQYKLKEGKITKEQLKFKSQKYIEEARFKLNKLKGMYKFNFIKYQYRVYSAFTSTPKCWRKYIKTSTGGNLFEGFDIHASIVRIQPLVFLEQERSEKLMKDVNKIEEELAEGKDIYITFAKGDKNLRDKMKQSVMEATFCNNDDFVTRVKSKPYVNMIKDFYLENTPRMYQMRSVWREEKNPNYEQQMDEYLKYRKKEKQYEQEKRKWKREQKKGLHVDQCFKKRDFTIFKHVPKQGKSLIWQDFQRIETRLMLELMKRTEQKFGCICYHIHDGFDTNVELTDEQRKWIDDQFMMIYNEYKNKLIGVEVKIEKPVYKAVENKIIQVQTEPALDEAALTALMEGTEEFI